MTSRADRGPYGSLAGKSIFEETKGLLNQSDILLANFEFPFTNLHKRYGLLSREELFLSPTEEGALSGVNWTVFTIATNHIVDWGLESLKTTQDILSKYSKFVIGAGATIEDAARGCVLQVGDITFGFLAYCKEGLYSVTERQPGSNPIDAARIKNDIREYKARGIQHVIVSLHWGVEFCSYPSPHDVDLAHQIIDEGASLVVGHHPHTLQGIERYKNGIVAFSLGNFIFDMDVDKRPRHEAWLKGHWGGVLSVYFDEHNVLDHSFEPTVITGRMETKLPDKRTKELILNHLNEISSGDSAHKFHEQALPNILGREINAWKDMIRKHGFSGIFLLVRTIRLKHFKMIAGYVGAVVRRSLSGHDRIG